MDEDQKSEIIRSLKNDEEIPLKYKDALFPRKPTAVPQEYRLEYAGKKREEDILAETMSVPFQPVKKFGNIREDEWHNKLIFGDNLQALKHLLELKKKGGTKKSRRERRSKTSLYRSTFCFQARFQRI